MTTTTIDLADADAAAAALPDVQRLLERAKCLNDAIEAPGASNDEWFQRFASDACYSASKETPPFPQLLAAFDAAVEQVATPAQKKQQPYNYNVTHFLGAMSQQQRRALRLALHADVEALLAAARRNSFLFQFDGAPLLLPPGSTSTADAVVFQLDGAPPLHSASTADARRALDALYEEAQAQLAALKRRMDALAHANEPLAKIDAGLAAADAFAADGHLAKLSPDAPLPAPTLKERKSMAPAAAGGEDGGKKKRTKTADAR